MNAISQRFPITVNGPDAARDSEKLRRDLAKSSWPYDDEFAPPGSIYVHGCSPGNTVGGAIALQATAVPATGSSANIGCLQVPDGMKFYMRRILIAYDSAFVPGDTLFTLNVNPGGSVQTMPVKGIVSSPVPLGSWQKGVQWEFPYEFDPLDILQAVAANVNLSGGFYVVGFMGHFVPVLRFRT